MPIGGVPVGTQKTMLTAKWTSILNKNWHRPHRIWHLVSDIGSFIPLRQRTSRDWKYIVHQWTRFHHWVRENVSLLLSTSQIKSNWILHGGSFYGALWVANDWYGDRAIRILSI